jgi:hypothetical protein
MPESSFDRPDCSGCRLRELVFFLPVLLEARERVDALLRLREGEDVRVAMPPNSAMQATFLGFHAGRRTHRGAPSRSGFA